MTKKITWRLANRPTPEEIIKLKQEKLLTQEEARQILFNEEDTTARDVKSLESEIGFLRDLVERLSKDRTRIVDTIRIIEKPYLQYPWYYPYQVWAYGGGIGVTTAAGGSNLVTSAYNTAGSLGNSATSVTSGLAQTNYSAFQGGAGGSGGGTVTGTGGFNTIKTF